MKLLVNTLTDLQIVSGCYQQINFSDAVEIIGKVKVGDAGMVFDNFSGGCAGVFSFTQFIEFVCLCDTSNWNIAVVC